MVIEVVCGAAASVLVVTSAPPPQAASHPRATAVNHVKLRNLMFATLFMERTVPYAALAANPVVEVYKTEYCGCCKQWIKHLEANGFTVKATDVDVYPA